MPDISMCINEECPLKQLCYRYTAPADEIYQAYGDFKYGINKNGIPECDHFWDNKKQGNKYEKL